MGRVTREEFMKAMKIVYAYLETDQLYSDLKMVEAYLRAKGVPKSKIEYIRLVLLESALAEAMDMKYERIYSSTALAAHNAYGFGAFRIQKLLQEQSSIMQSVSDDSSWRKIMEELDEKTGVVIRMGDENRRLIMESHAFSKERDDEITKAEKESRHG